MEGVEGVEDVWGVRDEGGSKWGLSQEASDTRAPVVRPLTRTDVEAGGYFIWSQEMLLCVTFLTPRFLKNSLRP